MRTMIHPPPRYADPATDLMHPAADETVLPFYLSFPLILLMSLTLWAGIWKLGACLLALLA